MDDELVFDAVAMRLSAAIDELSGADERVLLDAFGDSWFQIRATRNAIAHNYQFIDVPLLTETVNRDLGWFEDVLNQLV